jgi:mannose-6-phosphate isomerase
MTRLTPVLKEKIWGSTRLEPLFPNPSTKIGEVWFEGVDNLPLLVKFLFTTEKLSVQVHPDDAYARQHHDCLGKTEMWHVLRAEPGSQIAAGFRETITPERLREASLSGEIEDLLQWYDAAPGDTFYIPAGTVHAIGAGLTLCEIQQHSDVTYRLYDYGRPRELHLDQAAAVSHLGPHQARCEPPGNETSSHILVSCPFFTTYKWHISRGSLFQIPPLHHQQVLILTEGSGTLNGSETCAGEVWHLEAQLSGHEFSGEATLLLTEQ